MKTWLHIGLAMLLLVGIAFADSAGEKDSAKAASERKDSTKNVDTDDDDDDIGNFLRAIFGGDSGDSIANGEYDYFLDRNGDGIDDRMQKSPAIGEDSGTQSGTKPSQSNSGGGAQKPNPNRQKPAKRRGN